MNIRDSIPKIAEEMTKHRRAMHQNPQTAYEETFASDLVSKQLNKWGVKHERGIAVTGIVATIKGETNTSGRAVALRADMDALDIFEEDNKPHVSKIPGKMHGCGHDGHTAMLLGAAKYLSKNRNFDGTVYLIFQPAEEGRGGAMQMIEEGLFQLYPCDEVYGMHNWPGLKIGTFATRAGPIMASSDRFELLVLGRGGHAAMPHLSVDPIKAGTQIVQELQSLVKPSKTPAKSAVLTVTNFKAGTGAFNVIPETAHISGTLRTFDPKLRKTIKKGMKDLSTKIAKSHGAKIQLEFDPGAYDPTVNTPKETALCVEIGKSIFGVKNVDDDVEPCMGAEDFGAMLQEKPGCYVMIGQGEKSKSSNHSQGLHTPQYDFNDDIIPAGIEYWVRLVETALPAAPEK
ncbi:MAG: amidohydrolase [Alphaproteobacteria bacterium]|nr:amidohydrolase [Alphaproteobacteria bacterium]